MSNVLKRWRWSILHSTVMGIGKWGVGGGVISDNVVGYKVRVKSIMKKNIWPQNVSHVSWP